MTKLKPKRQPSAIRPLSWSYAQIVAKGGRIKPLHMDRIKMPSKEVADGITRIALDIFTDCTNAGTPFQDALTAIYISGLQHGVSFNEREDAA